MPFLIPASVGDGGGVFHDLVMAFVCRIIGSGRLALFLDLEQIRICIVFFHGWRLLFLGASLGAGALLGGHRVLVLAVSGAEKRKILPRTAQISGKS